MPHDYGKPVTRARATGKETTRGRAAALVLVLFAVLLLFSLLSGNAPIKDVRDAFAWRHCPDLDPKHFRCGRLRVPLDHLQATNATLRTINIAVVKYMTHPNKPPKQGTIIVNPGGPGGSGKEFAIQASKLISFLSGGEYDILGFDPRGIADSNSVKCFENPSLHAAAEMNQLSPPNALGSTTLVSKFASHQELMAKSCGKWSADLLPYISTAYTARDIDLIREALKEPLTNYWGFSYGTFLGITYANMFPDRVGRVIIDGVTDPDTFAGNYLDWSLSSLVDAQKVVDGLSRLCFEAGPSQCRLSQDGDNELSVKDRIEAYFKSLAENPLILVDAAVPQVFEATDAISVLFQATYSPKSWKTVADAFASAIYDGNATSLANLQKQKLDEKDACPFKDNSGMFGFPSVKCNDGFGDATNSLDEWEEIALETEEIGPYFGTQWAWMGLVCKYWPSKAVERFAGPWNHTTKNKVLLIGNTFDPVTPLKSAKLAESLMGGNGRLLTHNAYGHCSLGQFGACTMGYVREFFTTGSYPAAGTVCNLTKEEENPFLQQTILSAAGIKRLDQASKWNLDDLAQELEAVQAFLAHTNFR
ncbi:hypothetical protein CcCBS67573_g09062 [Chytriomyces confervae]|uniref:AB hydrolase-1 domain-containing protein n=1 Tax=Chytriomyces confervae TaxID=246404 RepID=A0A507E8P3_9FUNG|nr:hypothetical protein CcCBS67573_g09062 [Chytriomyces confervae]